MSTGGHNKMKIQDKLNEINLNKNLIVMNDDKVVYTIESYNKGIKATNDIKNIEIQEVNKFDNHITVKLVNKEDLLKINNMNKKLSNWSIKG